MSYFDYVIVGGGPCGLTMAQLLSRTSKSILIVDAANSFGGCHRVDRVDGNFTEHSPRIYSTTYKNFDTLLHDMGTSFHDLFTPYNFNISTIGSKTALDMKSCELFTLVIAFLKLTVNNDYGVDISMKQFMLDKNFSPETITYIDRVCRVVDGAASDKFSLNEFLEIVNQQLLYPLYQPKQPTDLGLIKIWTDFLQRRGVTMKLNCELKAVNPESNSIDTGCGTYKYDKLILALNPYNIFNVNAELFTDISAMYAARTRYMTYVSLTFTWHSQLNLPKVHGFSASEWGVVYIIMSDYFQGMEGKTLVSLAVTILDAPSFVTGKTCNQTDNVLELQKEVFRQFVTSFKNINIPYPDVICMYPGVKYGGPSGAGGWYSISGSFFNSFQNANTFIPFKSDKYPNIYNVGCQNGKQTYKFTAIESAVTNSIALAKELEPDVTCDLQLKSAIQITDILYVFKIFATAYFLIRLHKLALTNPKHLILACLIIVVLACIISTFIEKV
jgi:hypothetical protein